MAGKKQLILGTRGSRLALWQAHYVKKLIEEEYGDVLVVIKPIKTSGDNAKLPLADRGGKALFVKEIEEQLLKKKIDLGVHSLKDMPVVLPASLEIGAVLRREDPRDVFISKKYASLFHLPKRARIGTSALRRQAQLKNFRPDFEMLPYQGNVETRLKKMASMDFHGIVLASAGLTRLGLSSKITEYLPTSLILPAVGQGAICIETRREDHSTRLLIKVVNDLDTFQCTQAERAYLKALGGDCRSPIAGYAELDRQTLKMTGVVASPDGRELIRDRIQGNVKDAELLGEKLAKLLLGHGAREILRSVCARSL